MYVVAMALAVFSLLTWSSIEVGHMTQLSHQEDTTDRIALQGKELNTLTQAALTFVQAIDPPAGGESLSIDTLKSNNLLPGSFPSVTPFGQAWNVYFVTGPCFGSACPPPGLPQTAPFLMVWPSGAMQNTGVYGPQYIASQTRLQLFGLSTYATNGSFCTSSRSPDLILGTSKNNILISSGGGVETDMSNICGNMIDDYEPVILMELAR